MKFWNFEFSLTFSTKKISIKNRKFVVQKINQQFSDFFSTKIVRPIFFRVPISIPNFPKIPKITLRKSCDEFWNDFSIYFQKYIIFSSYLTYILPIGSQLGESLVQVGCLLMEHETILIGLWQGPGMPLDMAGTTGNPGKLIPL